MVLNMTLGRLKIAVCTARTNSSNSGMPGEAGSQKPLPGPEPGIRYIGLDHHDWSTLQHNFHCRPLCSHKGVHTEGFHVRGVLPCWTCFWPLIERKPQDGA